MKSIFLKKLKDEKGQSLVEFALIVGLLLAIFFGITEFARAWYTADKLKNAANIAARTYAVRSGTHDQKENAARQAAFGVISGVVNFLPPVQANRTSSITVRISTQFNSVVFGMPALGGTTIPIIGNITLTRDATYRVER